MFASIRTVCAFLGCCAVAGCSERVVQEPPEHFGWLTALLDERPFEGRFGYDSAVAIYDVGSGQLQIEGSRRIGGQLPTVRVIMRCRERPEAGVYPVGASDRPVHAEVYLVRFPWTLLPQALLPRASFAHPRAFLSDSLTLGTLELETVDWERRVVRGRFTAYMRTINTTPVETLTVRAAFHGRLEVLDSQALLAATGTVRWSETFDRDCAAIRRPLA